MGFAVCWVVAVASASEAPRPAAVVVFDADDVVEEAVVGVGVVLAVEGAPLRVDAPYGGEGGLVVITTGVVVAEVDEAVLVKAIVEADDVTRSFRWVWVSQKLRP